MKKPTIQTIPLARLAPRDKNPNQMAAEEFRLLVAAIRRVGFLQPLLVRDQLGPAPDGAGVDRARFEIVDGVHRWRAATEAGLTELPCVIVDSDDAEAAALQIGMNRLRGELDLAKVAEALSELAVEGWSPQEMTLTGFSAEEVDALLKSVEPEGDEDILAGATGPEPAKDEIDKAYVLEVAMPDAKSLRAARRKLKKLGGGDLARGLMALIEEE